MTIIHHELSNKTQYGIESNALRFTWAGYHLFVILSSLIGDMTILVASIKYESIKLHRVIVSIIQHIAVCDMLVVASDVLPIFITLIADEWVFGYFLCYASFFVSNHVNTASFLLISTLTTSKLLLLKYPLRFGTLASKKAHIFCGICWSIALTTPITTLLVDRHDTYFSYIAYTCGYDFSAEIWKFLLRPLGILFALLPTCLVMVTSTYLLIIAKQVAQRERKSIKWQGLITVVMTAAVFCFSSLPWFVMSVGAQHNNKSATNLIFTRIAFSAIFLNTMSNFYIYCLTVDSFRTFVLSRLQLFLPALGFSTLRGREITGKSLAFWVSGRWQAPAAVLPPEGWQRGRGPEGPEDKGHGHSRARRAREWPKHASPRARRARGRAKLSARLGACQCYYMFFTTQLKIAKFKGHSQDLNVG